jgi:hypothetical protein
MRPHQSHSLRAVVNADGAAILDIEHDSISTLNPTGAYVWQRLERGENVETIIADLARDTGEDPMVVARDVREFTEELRQERLMPYQSGE